MSTVEALRQRLRKPLELELASGCQDKAVVGGLERLVERLGKPFAELQALMAGYSAQPPEERRRRLLAALALLADERTDPAPPAPPGKLSAAQLEQPLGANLLALGAQAAKKLAEVGIHSYLELLHYYPRRYEDRRALPYFGALGDQGSATVIGTVSGRKLLRARSGMTVLRALLTDRYGGRLTAVWFNQPWLEKQLFPGQRLIVSGRLKRRGRQLELHVSHHEVDDDGVSLSSDRIVGIYASTQGLSQAYIRRAIYRLLEGLAPLPDPLPPQWRARYQLMPLDSAIRQIHFPDDERALQQALRRLKFDEFFYLELRVLLGRDPHALGKRFAVRQRDLKAFYDSLPFRLTAAQQRALGEILNDMASPRQMARLLQGDVGSGKTVVAAAAIYVAIKNGLQAALMAPTEILARQHYLNLRQLLYPLGVRSELLTGTMSARERREAQARIASGAAELVVGTHALIQEGVRFGELGLAVIDEEHRFGVEQRRQLLQGVPDVLVMSATPIPRSLALTYYGDLELSVIDELPPGRKPVTTRLVPDSKRREVYRFAWGEIQKGRQVYLVTPLIEESEALGHIVSTTQLYADLKRIMPPACRIEMLHGKMTGGEKDAIMERFRRHEFDLLVSTTVIEVGVDIPNASVMIIENAERFGLAQLHQLRGRVGRGPHASYCILIAGDRSKKTQQRLEVIERYHDGFIIAEKDLALRGPGELRGTRQSGVPDLVLGDLAHDGDLIEQARELALQLLEADPKLEAPWAAGVRAELKRRARLAGSLRELM